MSYHYNVYLLCYGRHVGHSSHVWSILAIVRPILVCQDIVAGQQRILIISSGMFIGFLLKLVLRSALTSPLSAPNFSPIRARICVLWRILRSVQEKKTKKSKRNFVRLDLKNGWSNFLQIWYVDSPNWPTIL